MLEEKKKSEVDTQHEKSSLKHRLRHIPRQSKLGTVINRIRKYQYHYQKGTQEIELQLIGNKFIPEPVT